MRRFHSEREQALMFKRWKMEMKIHHYDWRNPPELSCEPSEQDIRAVCHCAAGKGAMRKRRPYDCGNSKCGTCHGEKFFWPKARHSKKLAAIAFEFAAYE